MQLKIYIDLKNDNLTLPINYSHILQGVFYKSLSNDSNYQKLLHNEGLGSDNYKLFTFSSLCGKHYISNKKITFYEKIFLELRSVDSYFIFLVYEYLKENGITFGSKTYFPNFNIENKILRENNLTIKMNSPICTIKKDENNNTIFLSPDNRSFEETINNNFIKKYYSYYNVNPSSDIELTAINISHKDKIVTAIKNVFITGWKGEYVLKGSPDYLTFLYNCGIGSRNSQGFRTF